MEGRTDTHPFFATRLKKYLHNNGCNSFMFLILKGVFSQTFSFLLYKIVVLYSIFVP